MKKSWLGMLGIAVTLLSMSGVTAATVTVGTTFQSWDFEQQTLPFGVLPSVNLNPYGIPVAMIQDLSGPSLPVWANGAWFAPEIKIIADIPNQQIENPIKYLRIDMTFFGEVSFAWVADAVTGVHFALLNQTLGQADGWLTLSQTWAFLPNPREEIVVIGLKGFDTPGASLPAALGSITISTLCVPEPASVVLLAAGFGLMCLRRRGQC